MPSFESHHPLHLAARRIGDRWTPVVVAALADGPRRFGDLQRDVAGVATNTLSARLRSLESDGIVTALRYSDRPPRYEYELTASGAALLPVLADLARWAEGEDVGAAVAWDAADHEVHEL